MKKSILGIGLLGLTFAVVGCSTYSNAGTDGKRVYFVKNSLYGVISVPSVDVCDVGGTAGLTNCRSATK